MVVLKDWLTGPTYEAHATTIGYERCINLYPENVPSAPGAHSRGRLIYYDTPGLTKAYETGSDPIRGMIGVAGRLFAVAGTKLYELSGTSTVTDRGTIGSSTAQARLATNGFEVIVASGTSVHVLTLASNSLAEVSGLSLADVVFADGYFVGLTPSSQIIRISGQYDGATWPALDFASAEGRPDDVEGLLALHRSIWTFGERSIEVWYNSGNADFPYDRIPGAMIEQGCAAKGSIILLDNCPFWLGQSERGTGVFYRASGYNPQRVSNHGIEAILAGFTKLDDCIGYAYEEGGHAFGVWTFPKDDRTLAYDVATGMWHERAAWNPSTSKFSRHLGQGHVYAFGHNYIGGLDGNVYQQASSIHTDNGVAKRFLRAVPIPNSHNYYVFPSNLEVIVEVEDAAAGVINWTMDMRYSKDGGTTFGSNRNRLLSVSGSPRCRWAGQLGRARHPYIEMAGNVNAKVALIDGVVDMEMGIS